MQRNFQQEIKAVTFLMKDVFIVQNQYNKNNRHLDIDYHFMAL